MIRKEFRWSGRSSGEVWNGSGMSESCSGGPKEFSESRDIELYINILIMN
jgi:hypothetical protein